MSDDFKGKLQTIADRLNPLIYPEIQQEREALVQAGAESFEGLLHVLDNASIKERITACYFLGLLDEERISSLLLSVMQNKEQPLAVRKQAGSSLAMLRDKRMLAPLLAMARNDEDVTIRATAIYGLGWMPEPDERVTTLLVQLLKDGQENSKVRAEAAQALNHQKAVQSIPDLVAALNDPDVEVRATVVRALDCIGDMQVVPNLERLASTDHAAVDESEFDWTTISEGALEAISAIKARDLTPK